jgi:hypothetical protein
MLRETCGKAEKHGPKMLVPIEALFSSIFESSKKPKKGCFQ